MFDLLDKTGLKTVLEQIKAKFPSSLPANGGNADTVDGKHAEDFIYPRAMLSNIDLNTILYPCSALIYGDCTNIPPVSSWGTLLCYSGGTGSHVQLWVSYVNDSMFIRHYDGNNWGNWKEISTTPIKSTGWITTPTNVNGEIYLPEGNSRKYLSFCSQGSFSFIFHTGSTYVVQIRDGNMAIVQSTPITYIAFYID